MDPLRQSPLLCFDNDGTLFASHEVANPAIQDSFVRFCRRQGQNLPAPTDEQICRLTGQPGPEFYREILPPPLRHLAAQFREVCLDQEVREVSERGRLFPGIEELLRNLRRDGRKLALVTNAGERYLGAVYRRVGYESLLDGIYHFGKNGWTKKSEMIRAAMADFGANAAVMVGDRASDLEGARGAGAPFLGCLYGYGGPKEIDSADWLARDVPELGRLLRRSEDPADGSEPGPRPGPQS
jgi:phosphoglycolate phosphatase